MLAIQIAIGIILAYAIIVNQKKLLTLGGWLLGGIAAVAALGALVLAGSAGVHLASEWIPPRFWERIWTLISMIPIFILTGTGTVGMVMLGALLLGKSPTRATVAIAKLTDGKPGKSHDNVGCLAVMGLCVLMLLINFGLSFPVWGFTPVGDWYEAIDRYGRANGWEDGLSILFGAVLWQWVWIPVGLYFLVRRIRVGRDQLQVDGPQDDTAPH